MNTETHFSPNFTKAELRCKCGKCKPIPAVDIELEKTAWTLEVLREMAGGRSVIVHSGARCHAHNAAVGGAENSQHLYGVAADVTIRGMPPSLVARIAETIPTYKNGGIGRYTDFTHVDRRKGPARWVG